MNQAYLFNQGLDHMSYRLLGARPDLDDRKRPGYRFAVWAPAAQAVSVVGCFNSWEVSQDPLAPLGQTGIWTGFVAGAKQWDRYKYAVEEAGGRVCLKADPFARHSETRPADASICYDPDDHVWQDQAWVTSRPDASQPGPLNLYEVHLGSWKRQADGSFMTYRDLAHDLAAYVSEMGYTGVELMPVMEHPLDASWGYQVTGYYSVTSRYGTPADFKYFVDVLHQQGLCVVLDWVPAHFPKDMFGLARFDGTPLYEHADTRLGEQDQWGTYVFDFGKKEVQSFLISNAWFWLDEFHIDGLRIDAVSSMLYLNYGRTDFVTNVHGGVENLAAMAFFRTLNGLIRQKKPACYLIAEEATPWPQLTWPLEQGGLGFTHKWNMGWMNDSLRYFSRDYSHRSWHHHELTFSMTYAFSERFVLPLSHDEVVHGKKSLIGRMPGDYWQQFACLRLLFVWQMTHPGAKLLFMGGEFGQFIEWRVDEALEWFLLGYAAHRQLQAFVRTLNGFYRQQPALWEQDSGWEGFNWLAADDQAQSVYAYRRLDAAGRSLVVVLNATPRPRPGYRLPTGSASSYRLLLNSDEAAFGGSAAPVGIRKAPDSPGHMELDLPPLSGVVFEESRHGKQPRRCIDGAN